MPTAEQSRRLARFTGLGAFTGATTAGVLIAIDFSWGSLYVLPGLVFGLALPPIEAI